MNKAEIKELKVELERLQNKATDMFSEKKTDYIDKNHKKIERLRKMIKRAEEEEK